MEESNSPKLKQAKKRRLQRTCPYCYRWFVEKFSGDRHIEIVHTKISERKSLASNSKCLTCGKYFKHKTSHIRHMKTHESEVESFNCNQCDETFSREDNLFKHRERKHFLHKISFDAIVNTDSDFQCKMCDSNFGRDRDALVTHITKKVCMKEEPVDIDDDGRFQCAQCPKTFLDTNSLTRHHKLKHGVLVPNKFECARCKKSFSYKFTLKKHMLKIHNVA